jgi:hypothetical protein
MTDRELMQQARNALMYLWDGCPTDKDLIERLDDHLAQPEPEPVAWHEPGAYGNVTVHEKWANENGWLSLYTTPPQREWQGLTDGEVLDAWLTHRDTSEATDGFARAIEAKLKEKNA